MSKKCRRIAAMAAALAMSFGMLPNAFAAPMNADAAYGTGKNIVENLDRGINAINTGNGMMVSWRFNANDDDKAVFKLYRDNTLIYTSNAGDATCYLDKSGSSSSKYKVETVVNGNVVSTDSCDLITNKNYFDIPLNVPTGSGCTYSANDCSVGDVDGDGQYEIFMKWDPSNSKDNSQSGYTGNVYIDCYTLEGKQLWRIDLGKNIRAGAHYTQFLVADFDCDGKAEMTCKTADGTVDGTGKVIGDGSKDYRNSSGYILSGPEYYTLFDGATGKALDTVDYAIPRGNNLKKDWGDDYGNRVDRFLGAVVYLDGVKPSAVSGRGYYTQLNAVAYDVVNDKLVERWVYRSGNDPNKGYHNGNHNCMPADVDNDGKQELVFGSTCIDDNGKLLWCNNQGHGDAMHLGDFLPDRNGLELWMCHENSPYGVSLIDAATGKNIFHKDHSKDTGRACAGNILASNPGAEFWGATGNDIFDANGKTIATNKPAQNMMIYWDGDLEREILDGTKIDKYVSASKINRLLTADGCASNNSSKSSPCLSADVFGDWREELMLRSSDSKYLRVYATPYTTDIRLTTLMHDVQYRTQAAGEQNCYNQPPHTSFYLGSDESLPERPAVTINGSSSQPSQPVQTTEPQVTTQPVSTTEPASTTTQAPVQPSELQDGAIYMLKNVNSGLYLNVDGGTAANSTNVQQWGSDAGTANSWKAVSAGNGYYTLISQVGDGSTYALDVSAKKTDNGTNVEIYTNKGGDNQQFKFVKQDDGSYIITTKITGDASCIEVNAKSTEAGANIQQWEVNGGANQKWILEAVSSDTPVQSDAPATTTTVVLTTPAPTSTQQTTASTTTTTTTTTTVANDVQATVYGDLDGNNTVDILDVLALNRHLLAGEPISAQAAKNADVDGDGSPTANDALNILKFTVNLIDSLPVR